MHRFVISIVFQYEKPKKNKKKQKQNKKNQEKPRNRIRDDFWFGFFWMADRFSYRNLMQRSELHSASVDASVLIWHQASPYFGVSPFDTLSSSGAKMCQALSGPSEHTPPSSENSTQNPRMASNSNRKSSSSPIPIHHVFFEGMMG